MVCAWDYGRVYSQGLRIPHRRLVCARGYGAFSARSDLGGGVSGGIMPAVRLGGYVLTLGPGILYLRILLRSGLVAVGCCSGLSVSDNRRLILAHIGLFPFSDIRPFSRLYEIYRRGLGHSLCAWGYDAFSARSDLGGGVIGGIMPSVRMGGVTLSLGPGILYFRILPRAGAGLVAVGCCSGLSVSDSSRLILFHIGLCSLHLCAYLVGNMNYIVGGGSIPASGAFHFPPWK